jgi:outer membrane protein TolC
MKRLTPLAAFVLTACMTAPAPPPTIAPPAAMGPFADLPIAAIAPVPENWWHLYDDPVLDRLVQTSLAANADLRVAYANLDGARAALRQARAGAVATDDDRERRHGRWQRQPAKRLVERAHDRL